MKITFLERMMRFTAIALIALVTFTACEEDTDPITEDPGPVLLDGIYIKGAGTGLTEVSTLGKMKATKNEVGQAERATLLEYFVAVEAGTEFQIVMVEGGVEKGYGPGDDFAVVDTANNGRIADEPRKPYDFSRGTIKEGTSFTAEKSALYHVVYDTELEIAVVAEAAWGIIGAATNGGWSNSTQMTANFGKETMTFTLNDTLFAGEFKLRYSQGWKIVLDGEDVRVNTNFGGSVDALEPGGDNIANDVAGIYDFTLTWTLGTGFSLVHTKVGDIEVAAYPEAMYLVGAGTAYGWDAPGTSEAALMHKCAGGAVSEGIYWKILHLEAGQGFKISAADWAEPNLGFGQPDEFDAEGVAVTDNGGNMDIAESGMYIVVLNLQDDMTKVSIKAAEVYGMGDAFGGWDEDAAANLFTVDNTAKTLTSPALAADGNIRMYAQHSWIPDWWNAEFNVFEGVIEYRNDGGDQDAVAGTTGQVITLTFDNNTGTIE